MVTENVNIIVSLRGGARAARGINLIGRSSRRATASVRGLGFALAAAAGVSTVGALFRTADAATEVGNRIRVTTGSTEQYLAVQERLFQVSKKTASTIEDTSRIFQRLRVGTRDLGASSERVINVVEELNAALLVSGATSREASAALLQLGQGIASNKLGGEELRSLRENLAPLAQALADELGVGIGQLKKLGEQGKLTAADVFTALENIDIFTEKLESGEVVLTFAQSFNILRTEIVKFFEIIQRSTGVTGEFNKAVLKFSDGLAERMVIALANGIRTTVGLKQAFSGIVTTVKNVILSLSPLASALGTIGKISGTVAAALALPFLRLFKLVADTNLLFAQTKALFRGSKSDFDNLAEANRGAAAATQDLSLTIGVIEDNFASGFVSDGFDGFIQNIKEAKGELTDFDKVLLGLADGLEKTAKAGAPKLIGGGDDPDTFLERAAKNTKRIREESGVEDVEFQKDLSASVAGSFQEGFRSAIEDGGDFFTVFGNQLEQAANESLVQGLQKSFDDLQGIMEEVFNSVADLIPDIFGGAFGEAGGALSQALQGALQFVALQGLQALLGGGGNRETTSSANVESAVTSTQAVRGVVAGPQEIAIANIGRNLAEVISPLLDETRIQTTILRGILLNSSGGGGSLSDADALAFGSAPLAVA